MSTIYMLLGYTTKQRTKEATQPFELTMNPPVAHTHRLHQTLLLSLQHVPPPFQPLLFAPMRRVQQVQVNWRANQVPRRFGPVQHIHTPHRPHLGSDEHMRPIYLCLFHAFSYIRFIGVKLGRIYVNVPVIQGRNHSFAGFCAWFRKVHS